MSKSVIIIPTYNEIGNIDITLKKIIELEQEFDIIVIDDNSPDGTGDFVKEAIEENRYKLNISLIERK